MKLLNIRTLLIIIAFFISTSVNATVKYDSLLTTLKTFDYTKIDSTVSNTKFSVESFITYSKTLSTEKEKVRAIYVFICGYMHYSTIEEESALRHPQLYKTGYEDAIKLKHGVCYHYAALFKYISERLNMKAEIVSGYTKCYNSYFNTNNIYLHAWSLVYIEGEKYLLDVTFADAGNSVIAYNYFLVPPKTLIECYYPFDLFTDRYIMTQEVAMFNYRKTAYTETYAKDAYEYCKNNKDEVNEIGKRFSNFQCLDKPITFENFLCSRVKAHMFSGTDRGRYVPPKILPANHPNLYL